LDWGKEHAPSKTAGKTIDWGGGSEKKRIKTRRSQRDVSYERRAEKNDFQERRPGRGEGEGTKKEEKAVARGKEINLA